MRPGFYSVIQYPVATSTVAGANGEPGPYARFHAVEESSSRDASVTIRLLRAAGEAAWESLNSRKNATHMCAQVLNKSWTFKKHTQAGKTGVDYLLTLNIILP